MRARGNPGVLVLAKFDAMPRATFPLGDLYRLAARVLALDEKKMLAEIMRDPAMQLNLVDLITLDQMYDKGLKGDGTPIGEYAPITISKWKPLAASEGRDGRTDHMTLRDTGDFYSSFRVNVDNDGSFWLEADTIKPGGVDLVAEFGRSILMPTAETLNQIIPDIRDELISKTRLALAG